MRYRLKNSHRLPHAFLCIRLALQQIREPGSQVQWEVEALRKRLFLSCFVTKLCPTLCDPTDYSPPGSSPWDFPGKNTGGGCHFLLQGIFSTQGLNPCLLHWLSSKEPTCQCRRHKILGFGPWVRKIPWRRKWQPPPVFLPGESHGQRSLVGYSPWGPKRVRHDLEAEHTHAFPTLSRVVI